LWQDVGRVADKDDVERLICAWFRDAVQKAWRDNFLDPERDQVVSDIVASLRDAGHAGADFHDEKARFADGYARHRLEQIEDGTVLASSFRADARALAASASLSLRDNEIEVVAGQMLGADAAISETVIQWAAGKTDAQPAWEPALPNGVFPCAAKPGPARRAARRDRADAAGLTLTEAFKRYAKERKPKPDTVAGYRVSIRRFVELHGDLDVAHVTKRHVAEFKDALMRFPARLKPAERSLPFKVALDRYKDRDVPRLTATTINAKHVSGVSVALQWASENGHIETVVSRGVRAKGQASEKKTRLPYALGDLVEIFALPVFSAGERPMAAAGEAAIWLPVLALYTGARIDEIGTLAIGDVVQVDGIDVISIRDGKTRNARRKVPLHREVKRLGFLEYVERRRSDAGDSGPLFPLIASKSKKTATGPFGSWWGRYARKVVPDRHKTFHSFRHTVKRAMRNAGVDKTLRDAVMGHEAKDVADKYGVDEDGGGYDVAVLAKAIEAIDYPGLMITLAPVPPPKRKRYRRVL